MELFKTPHIRFLKYKYIALAATAAIILAGVLNVAAFQGLKLGVDFGQGWLLGRPEPLDATVATLVEREAAARKGAIVLANADEYDGPRRRFRLSAALAVRLGIGDGALVELLTGRATPVRGWAKIDGGGETVTVGPESLRLIGAAPGEAVEIRAVRSAPPM